MTNVPRPPVEGQAAATPSPETRGTSPCCCPGKRLDRPSTEGHTTPHNSIHLRHASPYAIRTASSTPDTTKHNRHPSSAQDPCKTTKPPAHNTSASPLSIKPEKPISLTTGGIVRERADPPPPPTSFAAEEVGNTSRTPLGTEPGEPNSSPEAVKRQNQREGGGQRGKEKRGKKEERRRREPGGRRKEPPLPPQAMSSEDEAIGFRERGRKEIQTKFIIEREERNSLLFLQTKEIQPLSFLVQHCLKQVSMILLANWSTLHQTKDLG